MPMPKPDFSRRTFVAAASAMQDDRARHREDRLKAMQEGQAGDEPKS